MAPTKGNRNKGTPTFNKVTYKERANYEVEEPDTAEKLS